MHKNFLLFVLGATIAAVANNAVASILNKVLSPLGLTYA